MKMRAFLLVVTIATLPLSILLSAVYWAIYLLSGKRHRKLMADWGMLLMADFIAYLFDMDIEEVYEDLKKD